VVFLQAVIDYTKQNAEAESCKNQRRLKSMIQRDKELDRLFERIYEDNGSGKLSDERFEKTSQSYETEQAELAGQIRVLKAELDRETAQTMTNEIFMSVISKYTRARKLTQEMLNELIEHIEVYHAEKIDGIHVQKLIIHYNCIGSIAIPDGLELPEPEIKVQTRKGVEVSYMPCVDTEVQRAS